MTATQSRLLVAQPSHEPVTRVACGPLPVGVVRWPGERISIVVKATLTYTRPALGAGSVAIETAAVASQQEPLSLGRRSRLPGAGREELAYPSDFVPWRPNADVLLHGHAYAGEPSARIDARVSVVGDAGAGGGWTPLARSFSVAGEPAERLPLSLAALRGPDGVSPIDPVGPRGPEPVEEVEERAEEDGPTVSLGSGAQEAGAARPGGEDRGFYAVDAPLRMGGLSFAAPAQRCSAIPSDAVIELAGLSPGGGGRLVQLPGLSPHVILETPWVDRPIEMVCDTLWIDTDRELVVLVWRGQAHVTGGGRHVQRIVVSLERDSAPRPREERERALARGGSSHALEAADLAAPMPAPDPMLALEKYARWEEPVEPSLPLERYAAVAAELGERREPRREALERHGLSEDDWMLEERAWLEKMGDAAMRGDDALATRYGALFVAAQEALATPAERARTMDDYATLKVAVEADGMTRALHERSMTMPEWMRLERRWTREAAADAGVRAEMERRLTVARLARDSEGGAGR